MGIPMSIDTYRHGCRIHTHGPDHTKPLMLPHTLPPLLPWPHTPSHPRSLTHPSDVSWSKMPAGSTLIWLPARLSSLGTTRGGSQPSHTPPAHARCVHQHAHACAPCTCTGHMHVPRAHAPCTCTCAPWLSLSLRLHAPCMRVRMCMLL
jgi:hypothetical protein